MAQQLPAVDALVARVRIGEMPADVAQRRGAEERIADGVQQDVGVAVAEQDRKSTRLNSSHPSISRLFPYTTLFRSMIVASTLTTRCPFCFNSWATWRSSSRLSMPL